MPLRNIVVLLPLERLQYSLFLHQLRVPFSSAGSGTRICPAGGSPSAKHKKTSPSENKKKQSTINGTLFVLYYDCSKGSILVLFADFRHPGAIHAVVNSAYGLCPAHSICDDFLNVFILVGRIGLVTGLEIENLTSFSYVGKT